MKSIGYGLLAVWRGVTGTTCWYGEMQFCFRVIMLIIVAAVVLVLTGCEVAGQLTILDQNQYEISVGEIPDSPAIGSYPAPNGIGFMFQLKRDF